ncbi:hypothetical protein PTHTG4_00100 [Parageobacillus thermoglucosidasius]|nr:hypothetical protein PTHTG4_00100 [Parageobacillus thermoglucosidasius]
MKQKSLRDFKLEILKMEHERELAFREFMLKHELKLLKIKRNLEESHSRVSK